LLFLKISKGAIFMYGPATSLALLINLDEKVCIGMIGFIGTFYTTIGGIKGVIWNDLFQALIMFASLIIIISKGVYDVGGFSNLWEINANGGRLNLFNFNPDPFIRQSFWSLIFGQILLSSMSFCFDQIMIQRFLAAKTKKIAQRALLLNSPGIFVLVSLCCFVGLCLYANLFGCDPLTHTDPSKRIRNPNQLVGYFVINNLNEIPGMAGFFLASIFCGSLSSLSSYLNSQAAIIWQDFFKVFQYFRDFEDAKSLRMNKLIVLACGIVSTGFAFLISSIGSNLNQISISLNGALNAPILGLFLLGMFFSMTNSVGVIMGAAAGLAAGLWLSIGAYVVKPIYPKLDTSTELCPNQTILVFNNKNLTMANDLTGLDKFYSLSYMWYMPFGVLVTLIVGLIFSIFTGGLKNRQQLEEKKSFIYYDLVWFCSCNK
jgi:SSS family transporter